MKQRDIFQSKECLCKDCVLYHGVQYLQSCPLQHLINIKQHTPRVKQYIYLHVKGPLLLYDFNQNCNMWSFLLNLPYLILQTIWQSSHCFMRSLWNGWTYSRGLGMHLKVCRNTNTKWLRCFVTHTSAWLHGTQYSLNCAEITHHSKMSLLWNWKVQWHHHKTHTIGSLLSHKEIKHRNHKHSFMSNSVCHCKTKIKPQGYTKQKLDSQVSTC